MTEEQIKKLKVLITNSEIGALSYGRACEKYESYGGYDSTLLARERLRNEKYAEWNVAVKELNEFLESLK